MSATATAHVAASPGLLDRLLGECALLYVSGKGGAGKTTVAAALGLAASGRGRRTIVCELAGARQLPSAFGGSPEKPGATRLIGDLWWRSVDPQEALREWLRRQPGGAVVDAVLSRSDAFAQIVAAAPGAKELVTIGKLVDLVGGIPSDRVAAEYELVVVDAPSTGHALGMLAAPRTFADAVRVGPVAAQARALGGVLADPHLTGYVGVSLPEDMSVREVRDLDGGLADTIVHGLDLIVVDGVYPDRFTDEDAQRMGSLLARADLAPWLRAALEQHRHARTQAAHVRWLREHMDTPVITLPYLFTHELGRPEYTRLARELMRRAP